MGSYVVDMIRSSKILNHLGMNQEMRNNFMSKNGEKRMFNMRK